MVIMNVRNYVTTLGKILIRTKLSLSATILCFYITKFINIYSLKNPHNFCSVRTKNHRLFQIKEPRKRIIFPVNLRDLPVGFSQYFPGIKAKMWAYRTYRTWTSPYSSWWSDCGWNWSFSCLRISFTTLTKKYSILYNFFGAYKSAMNSSKGKIMYTDFFTEVLGNS
jgi:hypothetical protein